MSWSSMSLFAGVSMVVLLGASHVVKAQPAVTPSQPPAKGSSEDAPVLKSPALATTLSALGTVTGWTILVAADNRGTALLGAAGVIVGPSLGDIYAGDGTRAVVHSGVRTAGAVVMGIGAGLQADATCDGTEDMCVKGDDSAAIALLVVGGTAFVLDTIYTVATAHRTAHEYNERARRISVSPAAFRGADGSTTPGVSLSGSF